MVYIGNIHHMAEPRTSISISKSTKDRLAKFGCAGESLETALIRVLEIAESQKAK